MDTYSNEGGNERQTLGRCVCVCVCVCVCLVCWQKQVVSYLLLNGMYLKSVGVCLKAQCQRFQPGPYFPIMLSRVVSDLHTTRAQHI